MSKVLWCWRCQCDMPMLEDHEASEVFAPMRGDELARNLKGAKAEALERYFRVTGFRETNLAAVYHHVVSQYGRPCSSCGKPLRTPRAKMCAACGTIYH